MTTRIDGATGVDQIKDGIVDSADLANNLSLDVLQVTETVTTKTVAFTPNLTTEGTTFVSTGTHAMTMPTAVAGKAFTLVDTTNGITFTGTIRWAGGTLPDVGTTGTDIYTFFSDGTNWYGGSMGVEFA